MKKFFAAILFFVIAGCSDGPVLNVSGIKDDITKYSKSKVTMEGVVSKWQSKDPAQFGIVDMKDLGKKTQFVVPVRFAGEKPAPGTKVHVTGMASVDAREFQATKVKVVK